MSKTAKRIAAYEDRIMQIGFNSGAGLPIDHLIGSNAKPLETETDPDPMDLAKAAAEDKWLESLEAGA